MSIYSEALDDLMCYDGLTVPKWVFGLQGTVFELYIRYSKYLGYIKVHKDPVLDVEYRCWWEELQEYRMGMPVYSSVIWNPTVWQRMTQTQAADMHRILTRLGIPHLSHLPPKVLSDVR